VEGIPTWRGRKKNTDWDGETAGSMRIRSDGKQLNVTPPPYEYKNRGRMKKDEE
jgi:hypothetical protein